MWVVVIVLVCIVLGILAAYQDTPKYKGAAGESRIVKSLEVWDDEARVLTNCYIPKPDGTTAEIDLIMIHRSGIYVIESKNYSGWIFGSENQQYWTQTLPDGNGTVTKARFYNPILQNRSHIKSLKKLFRDENLPCYSYVVFGDNCELKNITLESTDQIVTYRRYLNETIRRDMDKYGRRLSTERLISVYSTLSGYAEASDDEKQRHIETIKNRYPNYEMNPKS